MLDKTTEKKSLAGPGEGEIHLWLTYPSEASSRSLLERYKLLLTDEERCRGSRFVFEKHRSEYLITRALIRTVLSGYTGADPRTWRFTSSAYGRPQVDSPDILGALSFNISHTDGLIVCACTRAGRIGVDTEHLHRDSGLSEVADRYFSAAELAELKASPPALQPERFLHYWTLKESYIKAIGKGLSARLDQFSFALVPAGDIALSFHEQGSDDPNKWQCWLLKPLQTHIVAVCAERTTLPLQRIVARKAIPLDLDEPAECEVIAQTRF